MDENAFESFFNTHYAQACRFAAGLVGFGGAEDLAQEAFYKFYLARGRLKGGSDPLPYLYGILTHTGLNVLRRRRLWEKVRHLIPSVRHAPPSDPQEARTVLGILSPRERAVFLLMDYRGLSSEETARMLGITESTVRVLRHRMRMKIQPWEELQ